MLSIAGRAPDADSTRIAVLACLHLADKLHELERENQQLRSQASNRGEAARAFHRCREALARDLGVEPSPVTLAVFREVLGEAAPATSLQQGSANVGGHPHRFLPTEVDDGPDSDV